MTAAAALGALRGVAREAPNVLVVVMDTTAADHCSLTGYARPTTPRLDELARESVVFDDAWSPSSWTVPAHAALLTGRSPPELGMDDPDRILLPPGVPTLAEVLAARGWATACFTANAWLGPTTQLTRGFDHVDGVYRSAARRSARAAHEAALGWMRAQRGAGRPFFALVNDLEPHVPWRPSGDALAALGNGGASEAALFQASSMDGVDTLRLSLIGGRPGEDLLRAISALYDAEVRHLDGEIGALLDAMRAEGLLDDTLVVVTSDHGESLGRKGWLEHGVFLHRHLLRVPLLVRPPGGCAARRVGVPVELRDVFATALEACGVAAPAGSGGRSLLTDGGARTPIAAQTPPSLLFAQMREVAPHAPLDRVARRRRSIYDGRHHLVVDDRGAAELYDVAADPAEAHDLARDRPQVAAALLARLDAAWAAAR